MHNVLLKLFILTICFDSNLLLIAHTWEFERLLKGTIYIFEILTDEDSLDVFRGTHFRVDYFLYY